MSENRIVEKKEVEKGDFELEKIQEIIEKILEQEEKIKKNLENKYSDFKYLPSIFQEILVQNEMETDLLRKKIWLMDEKIKKGELDSESIEKLKALLDGAMCILMVRLKEFGGGVSVNKDGVKLKRVDMDNNSLAGQITLLEHYFRTHSWPPADAYEKKETALFLLYKHYKILDDFFNKHKVKDLISEPILKKEIFAIIA